VRQKIIFDVGALFQLRGHRFESVLEGFQGRFRRMRPQLGGQGPHPQHPFRRAIRHGFENAHSATPFRLFVINAFLNQSVTNRAAT
jgi:hypothetical protein